MGTDVAINPILSSDARHNRNCSLYLIQLKPFISNELTQLLPCFNKVRAINADEYDKNFPYGNLYSSCIASLEQAIEQSAAFSTEQNEAIDALVKAVYHNDNCILEQEYSGWISDITSQVRPQSGHTNKKIAKSLKDPFKTVNRISPQDTDALFNRFYSLFSAEFKPQLGTNLPSLKNYLYKESGSYPVEYRFSTQAQRHKGLARVSPLFKRWLSIKTKECAAEKPISHIYFNNLAFDTRFLNIAAHEKELSRALHHLEKSPELKVLVITLPAHAGILDPSHYHNTDNKLSYESVFNELLDVAKGNKHKSGISDFRISQAARTLLFSSKENEIHIFETLLGQSFKTLGVNPGDHLSTAHKQAVWFHFIKYELTNFIINKINPDSYNFSCKDAIDRGAVSSAYFNLMKSFEVKMPMSREEFELALDAAATIVKGRGMNFHRKIIWNALDAYINANYDELIADNDRCWLIYWRDMNCPHARVKKLLQIRLEQCVARVTLLSDDLEQIKTLAHQLLIATQEHHTENVSGQRLLLEVISRTSELLQTGSQSSLTNYKQLAQEIKIKHPTFMLICGIMETLLGVLLYIPTFGFSKKLIDDGQTRYNTAFFSQQRRELSEKMMEFTADSELIPIKSLS